MRILVLFVVFYVAAGLAQAPSAEAPGIKSVGTMSELMLDVIYPTSDEIFYVSREEKKTVKDWIDLRRNALTLAEAANLLMADNRARDKDRWMKDAKLLWEVGNKAFIAAKAKDLPALEALNADLYESCQSCHEHYRPGYRRRP
jgi:cytochrome c556